MLISARKYIFLVLFLGLIPFSCVRAKYPFYKINQMLIEALKDHQVPIKVTDTLSNDSLIIQLSIITDFIAHTDGWSLTSHAVAFKKAENGSSGLKGDDIVSVDFVSDQEFNGVPAGQCLNSFFARLFENGRTGDVGETIGELNSRSPSPYPKTASQMKYFLKKRPPGVCTHLLSLVTVFQSGKVHTTSVSVKWK